MLDATMFEAATFVAGFSASSVFYLILLCNVLLLFWYRKSYEGPYKLFPSNRLEAEGIFKVCLTRETAPHAIFQTLLRAGKKFQKEGVCVIRFFRHFVLVYGEEFNKVLFNESAVLDKSIIYSLIGDVLGNGLLGSNTDSWKIHRKILNPGISIGYIISKFPSFNRNARELVSKLQDIEGVPTEKAEKILARSAFNILAESVIGFNADDEKMGEKVKKFIKAHHRVKETFLAKIPRPWLYFSRILPWFKIGREHNQCVDYLRLFTNEVIQDIKASLPPLKEQSSDEEQNSKKSIAQILLEENLKGNLTTEEVADHVRNFMIAGYDTVYTALSWCLYELGHHPEVQEKLYKEIQSIATGKDVSYEEVCRLKYTDCVLKEVLRLYPSRPLWGRKLTKDVQCGKYTVPKGSEVIFIPYLLHRNPDVYPEPNKFNPDRFMENTEIRPWMHLAFAEGLRNCIGKKFAMLEMKVLLVHILRAYKVKALCKIEEKEMEWRGELKSTKKIKLVLMDRDPAAGVVK